MAHSPFGEYPKALVKVLHFRGSRDGSATKSMYCSSRELKFNSHHLSGSPQPPVIPDLENLTPLASAGTAIPVSKPKQRIHIIYNEIKSQTLLEKYYSL